MESGVAEELGGNFNAKAQRRKGKEKGKGKKIHRREYTQRSQRRLKWI